MTDYVVEDGDSHDDIDQLVGSRCNMCCSVCYQSSTSCTAAGLCPCYRLTALSDRQRFRCDDYCDAPTGTGRVQQFGQNSGLVDSLQRVVIHAVAAQNSGDVQ